MNIWLRNFTLLALMLATSGLTLALHPTHKISEQGQAIDLAVMIPRTFDKWREEQSRSVQIVDPQQKEMIDKIYTQHVPLRQNTEEKVRGKGLKAVWDDANE